MTHMELAKESPLLLHPPKKNTTEQGQQQNSIA